MGLDFTAILSALGEDLIAQAGAPLGLDAGQSVRVAQALGRHIGGGEGVAVHAVAAETGLSEEIISAMLTKLIETGKEKLLSDSGVGAAIDGAKAQAAAAAQAAGGEALKAAGGFLGKIFGKK